MKSCTNVGDLEVNDDCAVLPLAEPASFASAKTTTNRIRSSSCTSLGDLSRQISEIDQNRLLQLGAEGTLSPLQDGRQSKTVNTDPFCFKRIVHSALFSVLICLVIIANAIQIGLETDGVTLGVDSRTTEAVFLVVYTVELVLRFAADGKRNFTDRWFLFDLVVVVISGLDSLGLAALLPSSGSIVILRIIRLLRLVRILRLMRFCRELCMLVASMTSALRTVAWMWVLLVIIIYIFAILFCNELGHQFPDDPDIQDHWGTVVRSSFTLFGILTLEGWLDLARHLWYLSPAMILVIILFITITTYAIVNVVVAVIVQHVVEEAVQKQDDYMLRMETELNEKTRVLGNMFFGADEDGSGTLGKDEYLEALKNKEFRKNLRLMDIDDLDLYGLFDQIDLNQDGQLGVKEFVQGVLQMRGTARARRLFELHCDLSRYQSATEQGIESLRQMVIQGFQNMTEVMEQRSGNSSAISSGQQEFKPELQEQLGQERPCDKTYILPQGSSDQSIYNLQVANVMQEEFRGLHSSIEELSNKVKVMEKMVNRGEQGYSSTSPEIPSKLSSPAVLCIASGLRPGEELAGTKSTCSIQQFCSMQHALEAINKMLEVHITTRSSEGSAKQTITPSSQKTCKACEQIKQGANTSASWTAKGVGRNISEQRISNVQTGPQPELACSTNEIKLNDASGADNVRWQPFSACMRSIEAGKPQVHDCEQKKVSL